MGVVVSTGDSTVFGQIAKLTSEPKKGLTTLEIEILRFVAIICSFIVLMIVIVVIVWCVRKYPSFHTIIILLPPSFDLQGYLPSQNSARLDQCPYLDCRLRQCCYGIYS